MDVFTVQKRSEIMSRIRSKNTLLEKTIFRLLKSNKIYFTSHYNKLPGKPDIVFIRKKKAVFIDGDFWHGWNFKKRETRLPEKWAIKISRNIKRDRKTRQLIRDEGWEILRLWEHEIEKNPQKAFQKIVRFIQI